MTSKERHEARYIRRKAKREQKKRQYLEEFDNFDAVFTYKHLYDASKRCRRNVAWKASVQRHILQNPMILSKTLKQLRNNVYRSKGFYEFDIMERGKPRHIRSVHINERIVQSCLCEECLVPVLSRSFIYNNGACLKNKGYHFSIKELVKDLREHYREFGNEGYILIFDFKSFFDNVSHKDIKGILRRALSDSEIISITEHFIDMFGEKGLGLGSQISQIFALSAANRLDHYVTEVLHIKRYGRYNDDGYLISKSKTELQLALILIKLLCDELHITINQKKTKIAKLSHGFEFLKCRFKLTASGKIIKKLDRRWITKTRRKLKKLFKKVQLGLMSYNDLYQSYQSSRSYAKYFNSYKSLCNLDKLYNSFVLNME